MSLSKQLFLFITALFVIIFSLNFMLSVQNIKSYLEVESQGHAQDTATSLGLSLSPYIANETDPMLETMLKAIFDMGYYKEIKLVNVEGKTLVAFTNKAEIADVPSWFTERLPMSAATASSEISAGWNPAANVYVTVHPGNAYLKLFELVKSAFYYSVAIFGVAMLMLFLLLRFILLPLKKINQLALTIANGEYATIQPLPWTQEVRNVALSMNGMSQKIAGVINNSKIRLASLDNLLQRDDLTGLKKKSCFEKDMKQLYMDNKTAFVLMIKVDSLAELVKEQGSETIDHFLQKFAEKLQQITQQAALGNVDHYRFFGSEFVLLVSGVNVEQIEQLAKALTVGFSELAKVYHRLDIAHIGIAPFDPLGTSTGVIAAANEAFEQAQLIGANRYYLRPNDDQAKDSAEWKDLVFEIIDNREYSVTYSSRVVDFKSATILMEDALTQAHDQGVEIIPIGTFVAIAERFSKIVDMDRGITQKVMAHINQNGIQHAIAVSLSIRTVKNPAFRTWLESAIGQQPIAKQLIFSFSAYAVAKEVAVYKEFIDFVHGLGAKVMLKRFETQFLSLEIAKTLKADYIRLPRDLSQNLATDHSKRNFVETMLEVATLLDLPLLAENILSDEDYQIVKNIGLMGASR
ncbi:MAG: EAL domain-containing protein [Methylococcaceae bacterium]|nr:EAL domain-containing protein [Methylococcaceae bacterium]